MLNYNNSLMNKASKLFLSFIIFFTTTTSAFCLDNFAIGKNYYNQGSFYDASIYFKNAVTSNPKNINYKYFYALSLCKLLKLNDAQEQFEEIIQIAPYSEAAAKSKKAITDIQSHIILANSQKYSENTNNTPGSDHYLDNAVNQSGKLIRWDTKRSPLKIYLSSGDNTVGMQSYYVLAIKEAIDGWMRPLSKILSYKYVSTPKESDIDINFVPHLTIEKSSDKDTISYEAGLTTPTYDSKFLKKVKIDLVTLTPKKMSFSSNTMYNTTLHEMGHAMGIWGHSSNSNDVMYSVGTISDNEPKKAVLSVRDINTIKHVYSLNPDTVSSVLGNNKNRLEKKLAEAQAYVKKAPTMPISWTQLGNANLNLNNITEAKNAFNKAISLDNNYVDARVGLGNLYIKQNAYNDAIVHYKFAVEKEPSNPAFSINLAQLYYRTQNIPAAKSVIENLIKINPDAINNSNLKNLINQL